MVPCHPGRLASITAQIGEGEEACAFEAGVAKGFAGEIDRGNSVRWVARRDLIFPDADQPVSPWVNDEVGVADIASYRVRSRLFAR